MVESFYRPKQKATNTAFSGKARQAERKANCRLPEDDPATKLTNALYSSMRGALHTPEAGAALIKPRLGRVEAQERASEQARRKTGGTYPAHGQARRDAAAKPVPPAVKNWGAENLYRTMEKLGDSFPSDKWSKLNTTEQMNAVKRTNLSNEERWAILNAKPALVEGIGVAQNLARAAGRLGLNAESLGRVTGELFDITDRFLHIGQVGGNSPVVRQDYRRFLTEDRDKLLKAVGYEDAGGNGQEPTAVVKFDMRDNAKQWTKDGTAIVRFTMEELVERVKRDPSPIPVWRERIPKAKKNQSATVFYTDGPGARFGKHAKYYGEKLEAKGYQVKLICVEDVEDFIEGWNGQDDTTSMAAVICHSNGMSLIFEEDSSTNAISAIGENTSHDKIPAISDLKGPKGMMDVVLYACNAGIEELFDQTGTNVADGFRDLENVGTVYAYDGSMGFGIPEIETDWYFARPSIDPGGYPKVFEAFGLERNALTRASGRQKYGSED